MDWTDLLIAVGGALWLVIIVHAAAWLNRPRKRSKGGFDYPRQND